jgi:hypothetical protein
MTTSSGADCALARNPPVELACFVGQVCLRATRAQADRPIALKEDQRAVQCQAQTRNIVDWPSPLGVEHSTKDQTLIERARLPSATTALSVFEQRRTL